MASMFFHVEQRRAWVRTNTHTVVYDSDPDYMRFARDPSGKVKPFLLPVFTVHLLRPLSVLYRLTLVHAQYGHTCPKQKLIFGS